MIACEEFGLVRSPRGPGTKTSDLFTQCVMRDSLRLSKRVPRKGVKEHPPRG